MSAAAPVTTRDQNEVVPPDEILAAGCWRQGSGEPLPARDPADGTLLATVHSASADDVDDAVRAGAAAAADLGWRDLLPAQRARRLHAIAAAVDADAENLALLQSMNTGKSMAETRALVASAAGTFRYFAAVAETVEDSLTPPRGLYATMDVHEPIGVVGAITPWNSPIASDAQKVAPALAAGNAVLLKPAEWTPLVALRLGRLADGTGLPPGLLSVLPGPGEVTGEAIVAHPGVGASRSPAAPALAGGSARSPPRRSCPCRWNLVASRLRSSLTTPTSIRRSPGSCSASSPRPGRAASPVRGCSSMQGGTTRY
jgi:aldehyde dehydrogenase (NAD+)